MILCNGCGPVSFLNAMYGVDVAQIAAAGGGTLLKLHGVSMHQMCQTLYPNHEWIEWRLGNVTAGFWDSLENRQRYFAWLAKQLGLKSMEDWYKVTVADVVENRGSGLLSNFYNNTLSDALKDIYPDHSWNPILFRRASMRDKFGTPEQTPTRPSPSGD